MLLFPSCSCPVTGNGRFLQGSFFFLHVHALGFDKQNPSILHCFYYLLTFCSWLTRSSRVLSTALAGNVRIYGEEVDVVVDRVHWTDRSFVFLQ